MQEAATGQLATGKPAGGTPASEGSTRTGTELFRATSSPAAPPMSQALPIPDFVCQSFNQQVAVPAARRPETEAAKPPPQAVSPPVRAKPGRKPKKVCLTSLLLLA